MSKKQDKSEVDQPVRDARTGRFQVGVSGNKNGRPKGAPSLVTAKSGHLRDQILEAARLAGMDIDPNGSDGVTTYLHSIATSDKKAMSSLLSRVLPMLPVKLPLPPVMDMAGVAEANGAILSAAAEGAISTADASAIGGIVANVAKALEAVGLEQRLSKIEALLAERGAI
jgi:hypothetical protein